MLAHTSYTRLIFRSRGAAGQHAVRHVRQLRRLVLKSAEEPRAPKDVEAQNLRANFQFF